MVFKSMVKKGKIIFIKTKQSPRKARIGRSLLRQPADREWGLFLIPVELSS
jgi:hypothetical protein